MNIGDKVKILHKTYDGVTGMIVEINQDSYKIKLDHRIGASEFYVSKGQDLILIEKNVKTHHVTISTEKLKELIKNNYKWSNYTVNGKIDIVTSFAYFDNDKELWEFLEYMED